MKYDVIVIGSGLGGLVSALILAKEGKKVAVIEKNNQFGGNLQTFSRNKVLFDTGIHYVGSLDKGQNLHQLFNYLEIIDDLKYEKLDSQHFDKISFDGDSNFYPFAQGYDHFINELSNYFPEEKENIISYCQCIQETCNLFPWYNIEIGGIYDSEILSVNAKEKINSFTSNKKLQAVLAGNNFLYVGLDEHSPFYIHALILNSYIKSSFRFIHGGSQITKALIKQLKNNQAEVFKHQEVNEFIFENDELIGLKTKEGKTFYSDLFISNIDPKTTMNFVGKDKLRNLYFNRIQNQIPLPSVFCLHLVLKPNTFPYINFNHYHFKNSDDVWNATNYSEDEWPKNFMISCSVEESNQQFAKTLTIMTYMNFDDCKNWEDTYNTRSHSNERGLEYENFKKNKEEKLINEVEKLYPNIKESIAFQYSASPLSYRDYIGGENGNLYGYIKDCQNPLVSKISPSTKIKNLFLTGQSVNLHGALGVTIGGFITCSEILGYDYLIQKVKAKNE